jgi:hypothetical protein
MRLTFVNLTSEAISISRPPSAFGLCGNSQIADDAVEEIGLVEASRIGDTQFEGYWNSHVLLKSREQVGRADILKECSIEPENVLVRISMAFGTSWNVANVPGGCRWRIYYNRVSCVLGSISDA